MSDLIERQAAYDTLTGYYHHTTEIQHKALREALERVPSAETHEKRTETHACDCISRQVAIDAIVAQTIGYTVDEIKAECEENIFNENGYLGGLKDAINAIEDMPPAQPDTEEICARIKQESIKRNVEYMKHGDRYMLGFVDGMRLARSIVDGTIDDPVYFTTSGEKEHRCDTCRHEKSQWFNRCADCSDYELWEGKTNDQDK